jgi:hypothetical protein
VCGARVQGESAEGLPSAGYTPPKKAAMADSVGTNERGRVPRAADMRVRLSLEFTHAIKPHAHSQTYHNVQHLQPCIEK